jgi:hypothetical protein
VEQLMRIVALFIQQVAWFRTRRARREAFEAAR